MKSTKSILIAGALLIWYNGNGLWIK